MKVTKEIKNHKFQVSTMIYDIDLPAGLRVKPIKGEAGNYFLDEFPSNYPGPDAQKYTSFCRDSFLLHDASHYGIRLNENQVEEA